jgi:LmbE family N-acetylglucosaminyl deacetylase
MMISSLAAARQPDAAELQRAIDRLAVVGSVLYIAAHPDDENTRLLAWLVNDRLVRTGYLSLTRGEGGQNLIGSEQAPLLGLLRTEELLAARAIDGAEQWIGNERDFGYSKNPEETLAIWDKQAALGDVVWVIRRFRPDVILTRFSPEMRDTHGHHTASAMLAVEAFSAAADPKAFPEQLKWVQPWQARRIVWNKGVWGGAPKEDLSGFLAMDVGGYDALLGASYGELAARSRSMHKTQGFGVSPSRGPAMEYFKVLAGDPMQKSFLDGVDLSLKRERGGEKAAAALEKARAAFHPARPWEAIPALVEALDVLPSGHEKRREIMNVIAGCAGLHIEATADDFVAVPGGERKISIVTINRSPAPLQLRALRVGKDTISVGKPLPLGQPVEVTHTLKIDAPPTQPYWLLEDPDPGRWRVKDQELVGLPAAPPPITVEAVVEVGAHRFMVERAVDFAWNDPLGGERRRPLEILPALTVDPLEPLLVFTDKRPKELRVRLTATAGPVEGELQGQSYHLAKKGDEAILSFSVAPQTGFLTLEGHTGVKRLEYPHLPVVTLSPPARVKLVQIDLKRGGTRIGYVPGAGDEVPAALRQAGYDVTTIGDIAKDPLKYDAVITGVRAYNVHPRLADQKKLLEYVKNGGILLVQYNTQNRISKPLGDIGPYPFSVSQDRVTDENAPVKMADDPILSRPNKITSADFSGWIQERGLYFADKWDDHYQPLLTMNDPGEAPKKGALLVAQYGKGRFIYTGIAFFRQLPAGVPGAFRLFANLIAHGK